MRRPRAGSRAPRRECPALPSAPCPSPPRQGNRRRLARPGASHEGLRLAGGLYILGMSRLHPAPSSELEAALTLERFRELRERSPERLERGEARELLRELKAVGGDLRALRRALSGAERGPELWSVLAGLDRDETLRRVDAAL